MSYESDRTQAILDAALSRIKWIKNGYTKDNDTHHGMRFACDLIQLDINSMRQKIPKTPPKSLDTPDSKG